MDVTYLSSADEASALMYTALFKLLMLFLRYLCFTFGYGLTAGSAVKTLLLAGSFDTSADEASPLMYTALFKLLMLFFALMLPKPGYF
jgi:hypothetical protein